MELCQFFLLVVIMFNLPMEVHSVSVRFVKMVFFLFIYISVGDYEWGKIGKLFHLCQRFQSLLFMVPFNKY